MRYLTVDGMLSGTGVRDAVEGGYVEHEELELSPELSDKISRWLVKYENCHYQQFQDAKQVADLDAEGLAICRLLGIEIPDAKIDYFSTAKMAAISA
jgi:hypothetical protein